MIPDEPKDVSMNGLMSMLPYFGIGGGLLSVLGGFLSAKSSPRSKALEMAQKTISGYLPTFNSNFNVPDLEKAKQAIYAKISADKTGIGARLSENLANAGVTGQPANSAYVSETASIDSAGMTAIAGLSEKEAEMKLQAEIQKRQQLAQYLQMLLAGAGAQDETTGDQRGILGGLGIANMLASLLGNFSKGYADINKQRFNDGYIS